MQLSRLADKKRLFVWGLLGVLAVAFLDILSKST
jgi:hypothetical protein